MTSEHLILIELGDILGIAIDCERCGTRVFYDLGKIELDRIHPRCVNCQEPLLDSEKKGPEITNLREVLSGLRALRELKFKGTIRLHIRTE